MEGSAVKGTKTIDAESEDLEIVRELDAPGPTIDARARSEYRNRLRDLQSELDEADRANDLGQSERQRTESRWSGKNSQDRQDLADARAQPRGAQNVPAGWSARTSVQCWKGFAANILR